MKISAPADEEKNRHGDVGENVFIFSW